MLPNPLKVALTDLVRQIRIACNTNADLLISDVTQVDGVLTFDTFGGEQLTCDLSQVFLTRDEVAELVGAKPASQTQSGTVTYATAAEAIAGELGNKVISPQTLAAVLQAIQVGGDSTPNLQDVTDNGAVTTNMIETKGYQAPSFDEVVQVDHVLTTKEVTKLDAAGKPYKVRQITKVSMAVLAQAIATWLGTDLPTIGGGTVGGTIGGTVGSPVNTAPNWKAVELLCLVATDEIILLAKWDKVSTGLNTFLTTKVAGPWKVSIRPLDGQAWYPDVQVRTMDSGSFPFENQVSNFHYLWLPAFAGGKDIPAGRWSVTVEKVGDSSKSFTGTLPLDAKEDFLGEFARTTTDGDNGEDTGSVGSVGSVGSPIVVTPNARVEPFNILQGDSRYIKLHGELHPDSLTIKDEIVWNGPGRRYYIINGEHNEGDGQTGDGYITDLSTQVFRYYKSYYIVMATTDLVDPSQVVRRGPGYPAGQLYETTGCFVWTGPPPSNTPQI